MIILMTLMVLLTGESLAYHKTIIQKRCISVTIKVIDDYQHKVVFCPLSINIIYRHSCTYHISVIPNIVREEVKFLRFLASGLCEEYPWRPCRPDPEVVSSQSRTQASHSDSCGTRQ